MTVTHQAPLSYGILWATILEWVAIPYPTREFLLGNLPDPGIEPSSPTLQADSLLTDPPENSQYSYLENPMDRGI